MTKINSSETPDILIHKLSEFYNNYPDYKTSIVTLTTLSFILSSELRKFISRPHKQVTEIFLDRDVPNIGRV